MRIAQPTIGCIVAGVEGPQAIEVLSRRHAANDLTTRELLASLNMSGVELKFAQIAERLIAQHLLADEGHAEDDPASSNG